MPGSMIEYVLFLNNGRVIRCNERDFVDLRSPHGYVVVYDLLDNLYMKCEIISGNTILRIEEHEISLV